MNAPSMPRQRGLTLFEVAISILVLTIAVLAAMALLPKGAEAEIQARSRLFAAAVALNLMDTFHKPAGRLNSRSDPDWIHYKRLCGSNNNTNTVFRADDGAVSSSTPVSNGTTTFTNENVANLVLTGTVRPNFATGLRNSHLSASVKGHDFEHYLATPTSGLIPVPPQIARRLQDDSGELQRHLDGGGYVYYVHPDQARALTGQSMAEGLANIDSSTVSGRDRIDEAAHRLILAVTTPAQQNLAPAHPWGLWPMYQMYPFPPEWKDPTVKAYYMVKDDATSPIRTIDGPKSRLVRQKLNNMLGEGTGSGANTWPVMYKQGALIGYAFDGSGTAFSWTTPQPGDAAWSQVGVNERREGFHGRNWRHFVQMEVNAEPGAPVPAAKWRRGWEWFYRLAGNPVAGWIPNLSMVKPKVDYDCFSRRQYQTKHPYELDAGSHGGMQAYWDSMELDTWAWTTSGKVATGAVQKYYKDPTTGIRNDEKNLKRITEMLTDVSVAVPTYEMRASYRDYALQLWEAVRPRGTAPATPPPNPNAEWLLRMVDPTTSPALADTPAWTQEVITAMSPLRSGAGHFSTVRDAVRVGLPFEEHHQTVMNVHSYGVSALRLRPFKMIDPGALSPHGWEDWKNRQGVDCPLQTGDLTCREFPPHPAEVLALSYLAHAANMVAGWRPPFENRTHPIDKMYDPDGQKWNDKTAIPADQQIFSDDISRDYLSSDMNAGAPFRSYDNDAPKDAKTVLHVEPGNKRWILAAPAELAKKVATSTILTTVLENLANPDDVDDPGYVDPQVKTDLASRKMYSQSTIVVHPGDCLWFNYDDPATSIDERRYVYEVAGQQTGQVTMSVITPEQNSWTLAKAMRKDASALSLVAAGTRAVPLYVRRIFYADYHLGYIDASRLPVSDPYYTGSTPLAFRLPEPQKENAVGAAIDDPGKHDYLGNLIHGQRVATLDDVEFARKVHEMCIRWAVAYASENPYDWGAPRPANRPTMMDQPLAMFDIFAASGAARRPDATARVMGETSPFYRFIIPENPQAEPYWRTVVGSPSQASAKHHRLSHQGPIDVMPEVKARIINDYYAYSQNGAVHDEAGGYDAARFWPVSEGFHPNDRCRELVFWSVPWKSYEDAETVPSAPLDFAAHGGEEFVGATTTTQALFNQDDHRRHPEYLFMWRQDRLGYIGVGALSTNIDYSQVNITAQLGPFGADRNGNGRFDKGAVPPGVRLRAEPVARYTIYDPVLPVHAEN